MTSHENPLLRIIFDAKKLCMQTAGCARSLTLDDRPRKKNDKRQTYGEGQGEEI